MTTPNPTHAAAQRAAEKILAGPSFYLTKPENMAAIISAEYQPLIDAAKELCKDAEYALEKWLNDGSYSMSHSATKLRQALNELEKEK